MPIKKKTPGPKKTGKTKQELLEELEKLRGRVRQLETSSLPPTKPSSHRGRKQKEIEALLKASRAVLKNEDFPVTARIIFNTCKEIIGASSGYVALLSKDGTENEVLFLDPGGLPCTVDPALPMPIRGLRATSYHENKVAYENDFFNSEWMKFMPSGHVHLRNVLFAPLVLGEKTVGLLGLGNKPTDFTDNDARLAKAFGEFAAMALLNSRALEALENSEERFRSLADTASDAIISINTQGNIIFGNQAAATMFGYSHPEIMQKPLTLLMPERFRTPHIHAMKKAAKERRLSGPQGPLELVGLKKDGSEFPLELSIALWKSGNEAFFTGILRDITKRKKAEKALREAKDHLEIRIRERTADLSKVNKQLQAEMDVRRRVEEKIRTALHEKEILLSEIHHRVKNNLQVISSLLHLQSQSIHEEKYSHMFEDSQNRIRSMVLIHEKLYSTQDMTRIDFKDYIQTLANKLLRVFENAASRVSMTMDVEDIFFDIDTAVPCGLILNEIIANSIKHAFPGNRKGTIRITLRKLNGNGLYELIVGDDGVGLPVDLDVEKTTSLGLNLIQQLSKNQLHGSVEIHKNKGTEFLIRFIEKKPLRTERG